MAGCTLLTTLTSLMYTNVKVLTCEPLHTLPLNECFEQCRKVHTCQSYFHKSETNSCCLKTSRLQPSNLLVERGIDYYWLYPDYCHPDTGYSLSRYADVCFRVYTNPVSWDSARQACEAEGATLVKLNTQRKMITARRHIRSNTNYRALSFAIGGTFNAVTSRWEWMDGTEMSNGDWDSGHGYPISDTSYTAVVMETTVIHLWRNVQPDVQTGGYICELPFMSLNPYV